MTTKEITHETERVLRIMGCASVEILAAEVRIPGFSVTARVPLIRRALRELSAHKRAIGGQKAIRWDAQIKSRIPAVTRTTQYSLKPWKTASGSTGIAPE